MLVEKSVDKKALRKPGLIWKDTIKIVLKEIG
jgi:hypothetical protein